MFSRKEELSESGDPDPVVQVTRDRSAESTGCAVDPAARLPLVPYLSARPQPDRPLSQPRGPGAQSTPVCVEKAKDPITPPLPPERQGTCSSRRYWRIESKLRRSEIVPLPIGGAVDPPMMIHELCTRCTTYDGPRCPERSQKKRLPNASFWFDSTPFTQSQQVSLMMPCVMQILQAAPCPLPQRDALAPQDSSRRVKRRLVDCIQGTR